MKAKDVLIYQGITPIDIERRMSNNQIKLNGTPIHNIDINCNENFLMEIREFLLNGFTLEQLKKYNILHMKNIDVLFEEGHNIPVFKWLNGFYCLSISKTCKYILMKN